MRDGQKKFHKNIPTSLYPRYLVDMHRFIVSHNTFNYFLSTLFIFYMVFNTIISTLAKSLMKGHGNVYRIVFLLLTGMEIEPTKREISQMVTLVLLLLIILFIVSFFTKPNNKIIPSPHYIRLASTLLLYLVPFLLSIAITIFTSAFQVISADENPSLFTMAIIGFILVAFFNSVSVISHSSTAYNIPHIYFMKNRQAGLLNIFGVFAYHTVVNFSLAIDLKGFVYATILTFVATLLCIFLLPSDNSWMNVLITFYYISAAVCSLLKVLLIELPITTVILIHIALFIFVIIIIYGVRRIYECRFNRLYLLTFGHRVDATEEILNEDLKTFPLVQLWSMCRNSQKLSIDALLKIQSEINRRNFHTHEESIFEKSLEFVVAERLERTVPSDDVLLADIKQKIKWYRREFWFSVWAADYSKLSTTASKLGRWKYEMQSSMRGIGTYKPFDDEEKHQIDQCSFGTFFFIFSTILVICLSLFFIEQLCVNYSKTFDTQYSFYTLRELIGHIMLMFAEVWKESGGPRLNMNFLAVKREFAGIKNSTRRDLMDFAWRTCDNNTLSYWFDDYIREVEDYAMNPTTYDPKRIRQPMIRKCLKEFFTDYSSGFFVDFMTDFRPQYVMTLVLHITAFIIYVIIFFGYAVIKSRKLHQTIGTFKFIPKNIIGGRLGVPPGTTLLSTMPRPPQRIEWSALMNQLVAIGTVLLMIIVGLTVDTVLYTQTTIDLEERNQRLKHFGYMDTAMTYISNEFYGNRTLRVANAKDDMSLVDEYLNLLLRHPDSRDFASLISDEIVKSVASYLIGPYLVSLPDIREVSEIVLSIPNLEQSIRTLPNYFILRLIATLVVALTFFTLSTYYMLVLNWKGEYAVRECDYLLAETGCTENSLTDYNSSELPFLYIEVSAKNRILFSTNIAKQEFSITKANFNEANIPPSLQSEIRTSLKEFLDNPGTDPIKLQGPDNRGFVLIPSYSGNAKIQLLSYSLFRLPADDLPGASGVSGLPKFSQLYPPVVSPEQPLPQLLEAKASPLLVLMVRLVGIDEWSSEAEHAAIESFTKSVLSAADAAMEEQFMRLEISDGCIIFVSLPGSTIAGRWNFLGVAAAFGNRVRKAVRKIASKHDAPVYASVVFSRYEEQLIWAPGMRCTQTDLIGEAQTFTAKALAEFGIDGIGFASVHRTVMRIPDTTLIKCYQYGSSLVDLFLVV